jgi:hypothetical protein
MTIENVKERELFNEKNAPDKKKLIYFDDIRFLE